MVRTTHEPDVTTLLDRLAAFDAAGEPVISLYLNLQANERGRDQSAPFVRKALTARARTFPAGSTRRAAFDQDLARIEAFLTSDVPPSANGVAIFACGAGGLFETLVLDAPIADHQVAVSPRPHLLPLERLLDQHPRHAVVLTNSQSARVLVVERGRAVSSEVIQGEPIRRTSGGGWSQMRYQRHTDKLHGDHIREVVSVLERLVRDEGIDYLVLAGDDVNLSLVQKALPKDLNERVIDTVNLEAHAPEHEILRAAAEAVRRHDASSDEETVGHALDAYRGGGLGIAGLRETIEALERGQVDELLITAADSFNANGHTIAADDLVGRARQTAARVRFIENAALLADVDGVAGVLRFRIHT